MFIQNTISNQNVSSEYYKFKGNEPLLLNNRQDVWLIKSGSMSLFAITVKNGVPEGKRRYLFNTAPGEAMFSIAAEHQGGVRQILAISLEETELIRLSRQDFEHLLATKGGYAVERLERWIHQLGSTLAQKIPAHNFSVAEPGMQFSALASGEIYQPDPDTVSWVRLQRGNAKLMGFSELLLEPASGMIPMSGSMWLEAEDMVELENLSTSDITEPDTLMVSLGQLQIDFLKAIDLIKKEENRQELRRFEERKQLNRQVMDDTLGELTAVVQQGTQSFIPQEAASGSEDKALLIAAGAVGRAQGITIRPPAKSEDLSRCQDPIEAVARASKVRMRRLQLVDGWWKKDSGPLLGFTLDDENPVALLPLSGNRYEIFNPLLNMRVPLNRRTAATLSPLAYMFYRPLPDKKGLNTFDLLKFAIRGHGKDLVIILLTGVAVTLLGMVTPQATAILMDYAIPNGDQSMLLQIALALTATAFGETIFQLAQGVATMRLETVADSSTSPAVWDRLLRLKTSFFRSYSIGDLESRVSSVSEIREKLSGTVLKSIFSGLFAFLNLGLLMYYNLPLALIAFLAAGVNIIVTFVSGVLTLRRVRPMLEIQGEILGVMVQLINGVAKLRVAGAEERAFAYWGKQYTTQLKLMLSSQTIEDMLTVVNKILPTLTTCLLFLVATNSMQQSQQAGATGQAISIGTFLAFNAAFGTFIGGVTSLSTTLVEVLEVLPLWKRITPILEAEPESDTTKADPGRLQGRIAVRHVNFRYKEDGPLNLNDVSIKAEPGEFIALVGTSGSGKSTLFRLLLGFETPESGGVYYDGQELASLDVNAVRRQLGVVLQNSRLMSASILENISSGALVTTDEAWEAAYMAGFAEDIEAMPMGMHTVVSEGGGNLSGGQRQRLLIARALVLKPRILLFDEATSALDNKTQAIVSESLDQLQVTRIVIAHRLSTIRNADRIYVLDNGNVIQQGSFAQLASQPGLFAQLVERQKV
jgi:NHLM bacteriocin system ABC transporter ATP-binding protein